MTEILSCEALQEIRTAAIDAELHPESLLRVPIIKKVFTDLNFRLVARGIDAYWAYQKAIPITVNGFNPFQSSFYFGINSFFSRWLQRPFASAREFNENDLLVVEVLFMVHDYLHAWTYQLIAKIRPEAEIFSRSITDSNLEEYSFYHLLSEAVAVVGLDYWLLSVCDINDFCNIGSIKGPLTVRYFEANLSEYQRFCPDFQVQTPQFLRKIAHFYCTGKFPGFDAADLRCSPRLLRWLRHELKYGVTQRELTRSWLMFLAKEPIEMPEAKLSSPLIVTPEFEQLIEAVSMALWQLVKNNDDVCGVWNQPTVRRCSHPNRSPNFQFLNLNCWEPEKWRHLKFKNECKTFQYFLFQYLSAIPFASVPRERLKYIGLMERECDPQLVQLLMGDLPRLPGNREEPNDLFFAN